MLDDKGFQAWANEHVVVLVAHNELGHEELESSETGPDGTSTVVRRCPLYPGLACRDHLDIEVSVTNSREAHLPRVPFVELCPNSWWILPWRGVADVSGETESTYAVSIEEEAQFTPKGIRASHEKVQARLGTPLSASVGASLLEPARAFEEHLDEERYGEALAALAEVEARARKGLAGTKGADLPASLVAWLVEKRDELDEDVETHFEDLASDGDAAAVKALRAVLEPAILGAPLPTRAAVDAWLAEHAR
ncbi:MAG: hypothetical protein H6806_07840 [Planctomycetes bacterium]|nr:hypothetical protein [Planctomycetota bacterium]MCB9829656.1 hypothetical protein [Planctomycetota bacterium]MCB9900143.1 hypothetical protein [Planctomycetota bacterium]